MKKIVSIALILGFVACLVPNAEAEEVYCAAFLPCDENGKVESQYQGTACYETYRRQCEKFSPQQAPANLARCENNLDGARETEAELREKVKKLRRKLRKAKSRSKR